MKKLAVLIAVVVSISLSGCGTSKNANANNGKTSTVNISYVSDRDILTVVYNKVKYMNDRKLDKYLSVFETNSDIYNREKNTKADYLKKYDVKSSVSEEKVVNKTSSEAQVQYIVTTTKVKGPGFLDSKTLYVDKLKKVKDNWVISTEDIIKTEYKDDVYNVIYENIKALNARDITEYMKTIDSTNVDNYNSFKDQELDMFDKYKLFYNLEEADVTSKSDADTQIKFTETITKNDNSDFKNNRTSGVIHVKKVGGNWRITKIEVKKTEELK